MTGGHQANENPLKNIKKIIFALVYGKYLNNTYGI